MVAAVALAAAARVAFDLSLAPLAAWLPACPLRAASGWPCPGCGSTRALLHLAAFRPGEAFDANPLAPCVLAGMALYALAPRAGLWERASDPRVVAAGLVLVAGLWGIRMLGS